MKVMLLWVGVVAAVLVVAVVFLLAREPASGPAHSVVMPQQMQPGPGTPTDEAVAADTPARAERGTGVEGVPSAGITIEAPQQQPQP
jgi:hypothetical protein